MDVEETQLANDDTLSFIQKFYDDGQYLKAWQLSQQIGPLKQWRGSRAMILGGRLAFNLGSRRLGTVMHRLALRMYPNDPMVITFAMLTMSGRLGPWESLRRMKLHGDMPSATIENRSDWLALKALNYAQLRDFQKAEYWQAKAVELSPKSPWMYVSQASILEYQDRNDEATAAAEKAIAIKSTYRPAIQTLANRYIESNRDQDAVNLLMRAVTEIESGLVRCQLASFFRELEHYEQAMNLYRGIQAYFPLLSEDAKYEQWLSTVLADLNYLTGDHQRAATFARKTDDDFYRDFAGRLESDTFPGQRVQLPVRYFKQHHVTCAPATLTAIADYWQKGSEHLDIVEKICYDGTPSYSERRWAAQNGFKTVEFTVTWETATALIDRGLPFTLTTIEPGNGHLQPIIGYDSFRKTLITRDPGNRHASEFMVDKMLERYASSGPRGMALVPVEQADQLEGITFNDAKEYDLLFNIELCLEKHHRDKANEIVVLMEQHFPDHRLTLRARSSVARYDSDTQTMLTTVDRMLAQHPDDVNFQIQKLSCLSELGRKEDRLATLREIRHSDQCHPLFWTRLAAELCDDAREKEEVHYLLKRAIRYRYYDGYGFYLLGTMHRNEGNIEEALELLRIGACLDEKSEHRAEAYFYTAKSLNRVDDALQFLHDRIVRFGTKSSSPVMTLATAFDEIDQTERSFKILQDGMIQHGNDGNFLLFYSNFCSRYGRSEHAQQLLAQAEPNTARKQWLHYAAQLSSHAGDSDSALSYLAEIIESDPLDCNAHSRTVGLIANRDGNQAAVDHVRYFSDRFPTSYTLRKLLIEWLSTEKLEIRQAELVKFLQIHSGDAWALRRLASVCADMQKFDESAVLIEQACVVDPNSPASYGFRGEIYRKQNRIEDAIVAFRKALSITIDYDYAIHELMACCNSHGQRIEQLKYISQELNTQTHCGDGLLQYRDYAKQVLEPEELLVGLSQLLRAREELWQAWIALARQLSDMQRHEQAIEIASQATHRFPLLPRVWLELASTYSACGKWDEQIQSLKNASSINPRWGEITRALSEAYDKKGDIESARREIEKALELNPRSAVNFGYLADLLWRHDDKEEALEKIAHAVELDPEYDFGWSAMRRWCQTLGKPDFDVEVANRLCAQHPEKAKSWLRLAYSLDQPHQVDDAIEALDKTLRIDPMLVQAYSQKAMLLSSVGRFEEARQVLSTPVFGDNYPVELSSRRATILADEGNLVDALAEMQNVVQRDPDHYSAWQSIADWSEYENLPELYMSAAKNMTRLEPQYHVTWGYLAEAHINTGQLEKAKSYLQQALQLSPDYTYAAGQLLKIQIDEKAFDDATYTVESIAAHISPDTRLSKLVEIESLRGDKSKALSLLEEFTRLETDNVETISESVVHLQQAGWSDETLAMLQEKLLKEEALPSVADAFAFLGSRMEKWTSVVGMLDQIRSRRELWDVAANRYLMEAQDAGEMDRFLQFFDCEREFLRATPDGWQNVGWLFVRMNMHAECTEWMLDWVVRPNANGWALLNLAISNFCTCNDRKAAEVAQFALDNKECPTRIAACLNVLVGVYHLVYGDVAKALEHLSTVDSDCLPGFYQVIYFQAMLGVENQQSGISFAATRRELETLLRNLSDADEGDMLVYQRNQSLILWSIARREGKSIRAALLKRKSKAESLV